MTKYDFNVDHSIPQDQKLFFEFREEMKFNNKNNGKKSNRHRTLDNLPESLAIMASGTSTMFSSSDPNDLCDRLNLFLQMQKAGSNSHLIIDEIDAKVGKLLEYKCISKTQHKFLI